MARVAREKAPATVADVRVLTLDEAKQIYLALYLTRPGFDKIAEVRLRHLMMDSGVQHGQGRVIKWLQTLLGLTSDGALGPKTVDAIKLGDAARLFNRLLAVRIRFYGEIRRDHRQEPRPGGLRQGLAEPSDELP